MSIEIMDARKELDKLEECANNPKLILTKLFTNRVSGSNFLYNVNINGKDIFDYLVEYLETLSIFNWCSLQDKSDVLYVYAPALKYGKFKEFQPDDLIIKVDMEEKTYHLCTRRIKEYEEIIEKEYKFKTSELSDFWKKFENLTFKKRVKNAFDSLSTKKKLLIRVEDFFFHLVISKNKVNKALERENKKIEDANSYKLEQYNENIKTQEFYRKNAPSYIEKIKSKQLEIANFFKEFGYKEDKEMDEY